MSEQYDGNEDEHIVNAPKLNLESEEDLDKRFPNRPRNTKPTLYFHTLCQDLLEPLRRLSTRGSSTTGGNPKGRRTAFRKGKSVTQQRSDIVERFIKHWRHDVGKDLYPALRLVLPNQDSDRSNYYVREAQLGSLLVKVLGLNRQKSSDARSLCDWKKESNGYSRAGNFPDACYNALRTRALRTDPGTMTIAEVNERLDELTQESTMEGRFPIMKHFYQQMNAEELTWLIRIIIKDIKISIGQDYFFRFMHEGAQSKWLSTSSLKTVCWTMYDETCEWDGNTTIQLFQCFQPQLCRAAKENFEKIVERMEVSEKDPAFWIQEKLDGERMQMHMRENAETGGREFKWYSRNGTDYDHLYGSSFSDTRGALTRYIDKAFPYNIKNIILDGEMITWDPVTRSMPPFGSLKSAVTEQAGNPQSTNCLRPLFKVFDCIYANDKDITMYTLRDRTNLLRQAIKPVDGRLEFHTIWESTKPEQIEEKLRLAVSGLSEGIVVKNPRSAYTLTIGTKRADTWIKIKPDYMAEYGEHLDCVIIGGYYGSGSRGGTLSSFLVGLRIAPDPDQIDTTMNPQKCWSFVKVGGGYSADDYNLIKRRTEGKWNMWDRKKPPVEYIELAGGNLQYERPDVWIKPEDSVVIAVKGTEVITSDRVRTKLTLRFPRFLKLKADKDWKSALSYGGFIDLQKDVEHERSQKKFELDRERQNKRRKTAASRKPFTVIGAQKVPSSHKSASTQPSEGCFTGLEFCIMTDMETVDPGQKRMTKRQLEELVSANGGTYWASPDKRGHNIICVADKKPTNVFALMKQSTHSIVRPAWLVDCVRQNQLDKELGNDLGQYLLPLEPGRHLFFAKDEDLEDEITENVDDMGDSYVRDLDARQMQTLLAKASASDTPSPSADQQTSSLKSLLSMLEEEGLEVPNLACQLFSEQRICFYTGSTPQSSTNGAGEEMDIDESSDMEETNSKLEEDIKTYITRQYALFGGVRETSSIEVGSTTHIVICPFATEDETSQAVKTREMGKEVGAKLSSAWKPGVAIPRVVTRQWIESCWKERTLLDEENFAIR